METYFKIKTFVEFIIPIIIFGLLIFFTLYFSMKSHFKYKLMERLGYKYDRGLGTNVAYEFQPHWVKGNIKINCRRIDSLKYSEIRKFVKSKEGA